MHITCKEAIEKFKENKDFIIPSEFLSTFPNNFGINLCAVKGFDVKTADDGKLRSLTVDFIPVYTEAWSGFKIFKTNYDLTEDQVLKELCASENIPIDECPFKICNIYSEDEITVL